MSNPSAAKPLPPVDVLRTALNYNVETGAFTWAINKMGRGAKIGAPAGTWKPDGYLSIMVNGKRYPAHRLAWKMVTGEEPGPIVDHKDGNSRNNRFGNLRNCLDHAGNTFNQIKQRNNTTGYKGVYFHKPSGLYRAGSSKNRKMRFFGYYKTKEEANAAAIAGRNLLHGEFACHGER